MLNAKFLFQKNLKARIFKDFAKLLDLTAQQCSLPLNQILKEDKENAKQKKFSA